uniref:Uncharacterized protein n=1 Tax=Catagonus wagneri TaxID=51154 RepID=A0A8C3VNS8_9CETA
MSASCGLSFSAGDSNARLRFESIRSSGFASFHTASLSSQVSAGANTDFSHWDHNQKAVGVPVVAQQKRIRLGTVRSRV